MTAEFSISSSSINLLFVLFPYFSGQQNSVACFFHRVRTTWDREGEKRTTFSNVFGITAGGRGRRISDTQEEDGEPKNCCWWNTHKDHSHSGSNPKQGRLFFSVNLFHRHCEPQKWKTFGFCFCVPLLYVSVGHAALGSLTIPGESCLPAAALHNQMPQILLCTPIAQTERVKEKRGGLGAISSRCFLYLILLSMSRRDESGL